jgi:hypothetical protein
MSAVTDRVRQLLGEEVPLGGSDTETLFTDEQIEGLLLDQGSVDAAVAEGWRIKAAKFASLVDVQEGTSKRAMSDMHKNALAMVEAFGGGGTGGTFGARTRQHKIVRT